MANQFDFQSGLDISSLTSVSQAQLMQAINQIAPLSNIGGILIGDPADFDAAFIIDNPRCVRYILIDNTTTPYTLKTYKASETPPWISSTLGTGAISAATQIVDDVITLAKLNGTGGSANQLLAVNAGGTAIEFRNPADIMGTGDMSVDAIDPTGGSNGDFVRLASGVATWATYNPTGDVTNLPLGKLSYGTAGQLIQAAAGGDAAWVSNNDALGAGFLPAGSATVGIKLAKLCTGAAASGALVKCNGTNFVADTPVLNLFHGSHLGASVTCGVEATAGWQSFSITGLSAEPKLVMPFIQCIATTTGFTVGAKYGLSCVRPALKTDTNGCAFKYVYSAGTLTCSFFRANDDQMLNDSAVVTDLNANWANFVFNVFFVP